MIVRSREWLLLSLNFSINEVWGFCPCFMFLHLWPGDRFFLLKAARLNLVLFALLEAEHSISQEKACHWEALLTSVTEQGGGQILWCEQMSECETRCEVHCGGFIRVVSSGGEQLCFLRHWCCAVRVADGRGGKAEEQMRAAQGLPFAQGTSRRTCERLWCSFLMRSLKRKVLGKTL